MSIGSKELITIDTSTLVHWIRLDGTGKFLQQTYHLDQRSERPLFSTVTEGEILGLARCWNWGAGKRKTPHDLLNELVRLEAGLAEIVQAYADLYYEDQRQGHTTGENDLWIAATAKATGSVLLTCDQGFQWLSPQWVRVEYVPETP